MRRAGTGKDARNLAFGIYELKCQIEILGFLIAVESPAFRAQHYVHSEWASNVRLPVCNQSL